MTRLFTWLFGEPEEINGGNRCPTYLYRWPIIKRPSGFAIYIHHFVGDDWSLDTHDHPKRFITIGFKGAYLETTDTAGPYEAPTADTLMRQRWYRAPWIRTFPAEHRHRIETPPQGCWTICIVLRTEREWGFWHQGQWWPRHEYLKSEAADSRRSCA